jgi:serine/threonine protein kinase
MTTSYDDDRTVIPSSERHSAPDEPAHALPPGTRLAEFSVLSVIGTGGFGIVYFAYDHSLRRQVAIKEYMPTELAERTRPLTVSVRSERHAETFATGLRSFINEAQLLAQLDHPSLLKVYRFWEANGTAYRAMPFHAGITLERTLRQRQSPPDEPWLRDLLRPLLGALAQMHEARCYHGDISPDNILMQPDGRPLLLDFGAARRVIGERQRAPTALLKTGYAPVEQYGEVPDMPDGKQGAWTDLYALGAVMYFAITGQTPPPAVQRLLEDKYVPLAQWAALQYSQGFLRAIDRALAVRPRDRPQSAAEMLALLGLAGPVPGVDLVRPAPAPRPAAEPAREPAPRPVTMREPAPAPVPEVSRPMPSVSAEPAFEAAAQADLASQGGTRRQLAWAGAAVAAFVGLAYLPLEDSPPVADMGRAPTRIDSGQIIPPPDPASAPLAHAELLEKAPPSAGTRERVAPPPPTRPRAAAVQPSRPAPRVAARAPAPVSRHERPVANDKPLSRRCIDIIQRVSLGEPLAPEERDLLKQECGQ